MPIEALNVPSKRLPCPNWGFVEFRSSLFTFNIFLIQFDSLQPPSKGSRNHHTGVSIACSGRLYMASTVGDQRSGVPTEIVALVNIVFGDYFGGDNVNDDDDAVDDSNECQ